MAVNRVEILKCVHSIGLQAIIEARTVLFLNNSFRSIFVLNFFEKNCCRFSLELKFNFIRTRKNQATSNYEMLLEQQTNLRKKHM